MGRKVCRNIFCMTLIGLISLSGCNMKRQIDVNQNDFWLESEDEIINSDTVYVEYAGAFDSDALLTYIYDATEEELRKTGQFYDEVYGIACMTDGILLSVTWSEDVEQDENFVTLYDEREGAGSCYSNLLWSFFFNNEMSARLMEWFPEGEIDSCSSAEAIDICAPLAEACGFGEAQVTAYAMTLEGIQEASTFLNEEGDPFKSAPNPEYEYITGDQIRAAMESGNEKLAVELLEKRTSVVNSGIPWTKEHEAYLLVYYPRMNELVLDSKMHGMWCIYVPMYGRVVAMEATSPLVLTGTEENESLISKKEAVEEVVRILNLESLDDITIKNISLVYSPRNKQVDKENETKVINPCWRIDYAIDEDKMTLDQLQSDDGTILINAVDGRETEYYNWN